MSARRRFSLSAQVLQLYLIEIGRQPPLMRWHWDMVNDCLFDHNRVGLISRGQIMRIGSAFGS